MTLDNFIPEVWSAQLLAALDRALVYAQTGIVNRDYEGEISAAGDTVRINSVGDPTVGTYTKNTDMPAPETLTDAQQSLLIDQAKFVNFAVDDVDKAQQKPKVMTEAMRRTAFVLRDVADKFVASKYTAVAAGNTIGDDTTPIVPTTDTAYELLVDLGVKLDEADVPTDGRWAVLPPWFHGLLQKDNRFTSLADSGSAQTLRNGIVGEAAGFMIAKSNNVPATAGAKYKVIAGHPIAWSYAEQIVETEAYRPEKRFADAIKALHVFGAKVVRPTALAVLTANRS